MTAVPLAADEEPLRGPDIRHVFTNSGMAFYKTARTKELDRVIGDIHGEIVDRETEIMHAVQRAVLENATAALAAVAAMAELDVLISLATVAAENKYCRPVLTDTDELTIVGGRHPLQECYLSSPFVANDTTLNRQEGMVTIITGPNGSGKSIYLKQVRVTLKFTVTTSNR